GLLTRLPRGRSASWPIVRGGDTPRTRPWRRRTLRRRTRVTPPDGFIVVLSWLGHVLLCALELALLGNRVDAGEKRSVPANVLDQVRAGARSALSLNMFLRPGATFPGPRPGPRPSHVWPSAIPPPAGR